MSSLDVKEYIHSTVNPILEPMIAALLGERPSDAATWMYNYLGKKCGATSNSGDSATITSLKAEISQLKRTIKDQDAKGVRAEPLDNPYSDDDDTEDDDEDDIAELPVFSAPNANYLRKPRASVSAEVYGAFNKKGDFKPPVYPKSQDQLERLKVTVGGCFMFAALDPKDLDVVCMAMQEKKLPNNMRIINQGDDGDCLYVIETGALHCYKDFFDGKGPIKVKELTSGDVFGELALLYSVPRAASVSSVLESVVWSLDRQTFNTIVKDAASRRRNLYEQVLRKVKALDSLDDYDRSKLIDALKPERFQPGEYIVREGDDGDVLYIIEEGKAYAEKSLNGKVTRVYDYKDGDFFGELALIRQDKRAASIVAETPIKVLGVDRKTFKRLLGSIEDIMAKRTAEYEAINIAAAEQGGR